MQEGYSPARWHQQQVAVALQQATGATRQRLGVSQAGDVPRRRAVRSALEDQAPPPPPAKAEAVLSAPLVAGTSKAR